MLKALVIGNGFDLYHLLPTRYIDFLSTIKRLMELKSENKLSRCNYLKYIWGPDSPLYQNDDFIKKCYNNHSSEIQSIELDQDNLERLVEISTNNIWIRYFLERIEKNIGWIDFEKEIANVLDAVQELFRIEDQVADLVKGVYFDKVNINMKEMSILCSLPFVELDDTGYFILKDKYAIKGNIGDIYISIDKEEILSTLERELNCLAEALGIYLSELVRKIAINSTGVVPSLFKTDKVLCFNYTDTYRTLYDKNTDVCFIHGSVDDEKGIILGINNDEKDELADMDASLMRFKKYYQRIKKETFLSVNDFLGDSEDVCEVSIIGHSIDITDKDILLQLINRPKTTTTIYYHDEEAHGQYIVNLISFIGKEQFDKYRARKTIKFKPLEVDVVEDQDEDWTYKYEIKRPYRLLEDDFYLTNTVLIGSDIIEVSVRDGEVGKFEIALADYLLDKKDYYNYSGGFAGAIRIKSIFNDNRYGSAAVEIDYYTNEDDSSDSESIIYSFFETDFEGIVIVANVNTIRTGN